MKRKFYIAAAMCLLLTACGSAEAVNEGSGVLADTSAQVTAEIDSAEETSAVTEPVDVMEDIRSEDIAEDIIDDEQPQEEDGMTDADKFFREYDWESQNIANEKYARLMDSFPGDIEPEKEYPADYCGAYYEDGSLFICLTDISEEAVKPYRDITGDDRVEFIQQEFPLSYLRENQEYISGLMSDGDWEITGTGVYQHDNRLGIGVLSQEALDRLQAHLIEKGYPENSFIIEIQGMAVLC